MNPKLLALTLWALSQVENPRGVTKLGPAGEVGSYQLTPGVIHDRGRHLTRASDGTAQAHADQARAHVPWLAVRCEANGLTASPYNIALAWNAGITRALTRNTSAANRDFAQRVTNLVELGELGDLPQ